MMSERKHGSIPKRDDLIKAFSTIVHVARTAQMSAANHEACKAAAQMLAGFIDDVYDAAQTQAQEQAQPKDE